MCRSLKDGFVWGVEDTIRGMSGAGRALALSVLSCFYLVAFAISALASSWRGLSSVSSPPLTITATLRRTIQFIFMTETGVFEVWMKSATCPVFDLQFQVFLKTLLKQTKQKQTHKIKPYYKNWESVHFLNVIKVFCDSCVCV